MNDELIPVTYLAPVNQRVFRDNAARVAATPYAPFFDGELHVRREVLDALRAPLDPALALGTDAASMARLLEPGWLDGETGYCALPDGSGYVASLAHFPGCTPEMFRWWFWWHSFDPVRYSLWHPWSHVSVRRADPETETAPGLSDEQRYIGSTHLISEYIGAGRQEIEITFVDPAELGFDTTRFAAAGIAGHACGVVRLRRPRLRAATMVHLIRVTGDGFELRSRYWLADRVSMPLLGRDIPLDRPATALGLKRVIAGERMAYEQLVHDQTEFTRLAAILPDLYRAFGAAGAGAA